MELSEPRAEPRTEPRTEPRAVEHRDGLDDHPPCPECGRPQELVMLERFTGWWCRACG